MGAKLLMRNEQFGAPSFTTTAKDGLQ